MRLPKNINKFEDIIQIIRFLQYDANQKKDKVFTWGVKKESFPYGIWFRGESDHTYPLLPGIFRTQYDKKCLNEPSITNHLQSRIPELYKIRNPFDKLCLAQHYNVPTRLLDWSESIFTATYFAVTSGGDNWKIKDSKLYILNAFALNNFSSIAGGRIHVSDDYGTLFRAETSYCFTPEDWNDRISTRYREFDFDRIKDFPYNQNAREKGRHLKVFLNPIAVMPVRSNQRMIVQSSVFTLHGGSLQMHKSYHCKKFPSSSNQQSVQRQIYHSIPIPANVKPKLKRDLFNFGIHQGTLFPEMDKQREFLMTVFK